MLSYIGFRGAASPRSCQGAVFKVQGTSEALHIFSWQDGAGVAVFGILTRYGSL